MILLTMVGRAISIASTLLASCTLVLASDPAQRAEDIRRAVAQITDEADPIRRLTNLEAIVQSGDATIIRVALKAAFTGNDAELKALAMRAYLASIKQLNFQIQLSPTLQKEYEQASSSADKFQEFSNRNQLVGLIARSNFQFTLAISEYQLSSNSGTWTELNYASKFPFTITGDRVSSNLNLVFASNQVRCIVNFNPGRDLKLAGTLGCQTSHAPPNLRIEASMF